MTTVRATVEIFGQRLGLRADGDASRLLRRETGVGFHEPLQVPPLFEEDLPVFDQRMREVADRTTSADTVKIAVLTALNIADELFQEREMDQDARHRQLAQQAERLVMKLEEAMIPGETREQT